MPVIDENLRVFAEKLTFTSVAPHIATLQIPSDKIIDAAHPLLSHTKLIKWDNTTGTSSDVTASLSFLSNTQVLLGVWSATSTYLLDYYGLGATRDFILSGPNSAITVEARKIGATHWCCKATFNAILTSLETSQTVKFKVRYWVSDRITHTLLFGMDSDEYTLVAGTQKIINFSGFVLSPYDYFYISIVLTDGTTFHFELANCSLVLPNSSLIMQSNGWLFNDDGTYNVGYLNRVFIDSRLRRNIYGEKLTVGEVLPHNATLNYKSDMDKKHTTVYKDGVDIGDVMYDFTDALTVRINPIVYIPERTYTIDYYSIDEHIKFSESKLDTAELNISIHSPLERREGFYCNNICWGDNRFYDYDTKIWVRKEPLNLSHNSPHIATLSKMPNRVITDTHVYYVDTVLGTSGTLATSFYSFVQGKDYAVQVTDPNFYNRTYTMDYVEAPLANVLEICEVDAWGESAPDILEIKVLFDEDGNLVVIANGVGLEMTPVKNVFMYYDFGTTTDGKQIKIFCGIDTIFPKYPLTFYIERHFLDTSDLNGDPIAIGKGAGGGCDTAEPSYWDLAQTFFVYEPLTLKKMRMKDSDFRVHPGSLHSETNHDAWPISCSICEVIMDPLNEEYLGPDRTKVLATADVMQANWGTDDLIRTWNFNYTFNKPGRYAFVFHNITDAGYEEWQRRYVYEAGARGTRLFYTSKSGVVPSSTIYAPGELWHTQIKKIAVFDETVGQGNGGKGNYLLVFHNLPVHPYMGGSPLEHITLHFLTDGGVPVTILGVNYRPEYPPAIVSWSGGGAVGTMDFITGRAHLTFTQNVFGPITADYFYLEETKWKKLGIYCDSRRDKNDAHNNFFSPSYVVQHNLGFELQVTYPDKRMECLATTLYNRDSYVTTGNFNSLAVGNLFTVEEPVEVVGLAVRVMTYNGGYVDAEQITGAAPVYTPGFVGYKYTFRGFNPGGNNAMMDEMQTTLFRALQSGGSDIPVDRDFFKFISHTQVEINHDYYDQYPETTGLPNSSKYIISYWLWPPYRKGTSSNLDDWDELRCKLTRIRWACRTGDPLNYDHLAPDETRVIAIARNLFDPKNPSYNVPDPVCPNPYPLSPIGTDPSFPIEGKKDLFLYHFDKVRLKAGTYGFVLERTNAAALGNSPIETIFYYKANQIIWPGLNTKPKPRYETVPELGSSWIEAPLEWGAAYYLYYYGAPHNKFLWTGCNAEFLNGGRWPIRVINTTPPIPPRFKSAVSEYNPDPEDSSVWYKLLQTDDPWAGANAWIEQDPLEFQLFISPTYLLDAKYVRRYFQGILEESTKKSLRWVEEENFPFWTPSCNSIVSEDVAFTWAMVDYHAKLSNTSNQDKTHCVLLRNGISIPDTYWSFVDGTTIRLDPGEYDGSASYNFEYETLIQAVFEVDVSSLEEPGIDPLIEPQNKLENLYPIPYADIFVGGDATEKNIEKTEMVNFDSYGRGVLQHVSNNNVGDVAITRITPLGNTIIPISAIQRLSNDQIVIDPIYYSTDAYYSVKYIAQITETNRYADYKMEVSAWIQAGGGYWTAYFEWDWKRNYLPSRYFSGVYPNYIRKFKVRITLSKVLNYNYVFIRCGGLMYVSPQAWDIKSS